MDYELKGTEEFLGGVQKLTVQRQPSSKQAFGCDWVRVLAKGYPLLQGLAGAEARLWWLLVDRSNAANMLFLAQRTIAGQLGCSDQALSKLVRGMRGKGLIRGKSPNLMLSPEVVYKGQTVDYADVMDRWNQLEK